MRVGERLCFSRTLSFSFSLSCPLLASLLLSLCPSLSLLSFSPYLGLFPRLSIYSTFHRFLPLNFSLAFSLSLSLTLLSLSFIFIQRTLETFFWYGPFSFHLLLFPLSDCLCISVKSYHRQPYAFLNFSGALHSCFSTPFCTLPQAVATRVRVHHSLLFVYSIFTRAVVALIAFYRGGSFCVSLPAHALTRRRVCLSEFLYVRICACEDIDILLGESEGEGESIGWKALLKCVLAFTSRALN